MHLLLHIKNDFKLIKRDVILIFMLGFVVYLAVALRLLLPWLDGYLTAKDIYYELSAQFPLIISYLVIFTGVMMSGVVYAFLTLDDKDDGVLTALLTTPLSVGQYLMKRLVMSTVLGFLIVLFLFYSVNIAVLPFFQTVLVSLGASFTAPMIMLFMIIISKSKVQGLNYAKILSFLAALLIVAWFVKEPFEYIIGLFPPYWISKAYWALLDESSLGYLFIGIGIVFQFGVTKVLIRVFNKRIYKEL